MNPQIQKLEALLARIKTNASAPRAHAQAEPAAAHAGSPSAEVELLPEPTTQVSAQTAPPAQPPVEREIEVPLESRARLVAAPQVEVEEEEMEAEVLELDDRHIVSEPPADSQDATKELNVAAAAAAARAVATAPPPAVEIEEPPPPSSRRPIAEPAETPQEAEIQVATHTPPPESGKQVAAEALSFDDDLTGVREAKPAPEPSIQLQSLRSPKAAEPAEPDEMEVQLPGGEETRPPPGPLPEMRAPRIESVPQPEPTHVSADVTRPTRPVAPVQVAEMLGTVKPGSPKTFGELLDATLAL